jgi:hypothetical protein
MFQSGRDWDFWQVLSAVIFIACSRAALGWIRAGCEPSGRSGDEDAEPPVKRQPEEEEKKEEGAELIMPTAHATFYAAVEREVKFAIRTIKDLSWQLGILRTS